MSMRTRTSPDDALTRALAADKVRAVPSVPRVRAFDEPAPIPLPPEVRDARVRQALIDEPLPSRAQVRFRSGSTRKRIPVPPGDSLVLGIIEQTGVTAPYECALEVDYGEGPVLLGEFLVMSPLDAQLGLDRVVALATAPGARAWFLRISQPTADAEFTVTANSSPYPLSVPGIQALSSWTRDFFEQQSVYGFDVFQLVAPGAAEMFVTQRTSLVELSGFSDEPALTRYVQLHETLGGAPVLGQLPRLNIRVPPGATFDLVFDPPQLTSASNLAFWAAVSSTPATFTPVVSGLFAFNFRRASLSEAAL